MCSLFLRGKREHARNRRMKLTRPLMVFLLAGVQSGKLVASETVSVRYDAKVPTLAFATSELVIALKAAGLLKRDPRSVERKKFGHKKARRSYQFSKR